MSKTSYLCIAIMITALLYMGAVRGYQFYAKKAAQWEEERQQQDAGFSFQNVPISLAAPQAEPISAPRPLPADATSISILPESQPAPAEPQVVAQAATPSQVVFLEDVPLPPEQTVQQATDTLRSIVQDYKNEPEIKAFNQELAQVTKGQAVDLSSLGKGDLRQILQDNPQIQAVVTKHMKDPAFAQKAQQILSNPQFIESVRQLQKHQAATQTSRK